MKLYLEETRAVILPFLQPWRLLLTCVNKDRPYYFIKYIYT